MAAKKSHCGDIHIPLCGRPFCNQKLSSLTHELTSKGLICVSMYRPTGKYISQFKRAFANCSFTVLHQCSFLWEKIHKYEGEMSEEEDKIWTINLCEEVMVPNANPRTTEEQIELKCYNFFKDYQTRDVLDNICLIEFANELELFIREEHAEASGPCDVERDSRQKPDTLEINSETRSDEGKLEEIQVSGTTSLWETDQKDVSHACPTESSKTEDNAQFVPFPNIFGLKENVHTFIRDINLMATGHMEIPYKTAEDCHAMESKVEEWNGTRFSKEIFLSNIKYALFEILPAMYKSYNWRGLAVLASCTHQAVQERAITLLELLLLQEQDPDNLADFVTIMDMEGMLFTSLQKMLTSLDHGAQAMLHRLSSLYLMLLSHVVMREKTTSEHRTCRMHFDTICYRLNSFNNRIECLQSIKQYVSEVSKDGGKMRQTVMALVSNKAVSPQKEEIGIQVVVVYQLLKQLFRTMDPKIVERLKGYVTPADASRISIFAKQKEAYTAGVVLLIRGLVTFLRFGFSYKTDNDVSTLTKECVQVLHNAGKRELHPQEANLLWSLFCHRNSAVRQALTELLKGEFAKKPEKHHKITLTATPEYYARVVGHLVEELTRLLTPLIILNNVDSPGGEELHKKRQTEEKWTWIQGQFDNRQILVVLKVTEESQPDSRADFHLCQISVLKQLQHNSLITMYAFQENKSPIFYLVEDYVKSNLQSTLNNQCATKEFFPKSDLIRFVVEALSGLEYCHSKNFIHRNLTAASLFLAGNRVKLCGFFLARLLASGQDRVIDQTNPGIPTLWSAPESLQHDEYSKESDVWMVGHLMYEVLTHGAMPYSHKGNLSDSELVTLIVEQSIALAPERCIEKDVDRILQDCVYPVSCSRPTVSEVKYSLQRCVTASTTSGQREKFLYPAATGAQWRPSIGFGKGTQRIAGHAQSGKKKDIVSLSDMIWRYTMGDEYVFTEKVLYKWPSSMHYNIRNGALQDLLPALKVVQNEGESPQLEIRIPSSCHGSLKSLCERRGLAESVVLYLYCGYKVAVLLEQLHRRSWALGDLDISFAYVQVLATDVKVHIVSLAYLQYFEEDEQPSELVLPEDNATHARAAPEVVRSGLYSCDSDVYCFGHFLKNLLAAYESGRKLKHSKASEEREAVEPELEDAGPGSQPEGLQALIASCLKDRDRPSSAKVVADLSSILKNHFLLRWGDNSLGQDKAHGVASVESLCTAIFNKIA